MKSAMFAKGLKVKTDLNLWHKRIDHINLQKLQNMGLCNESCRDDSVQRIRYGMCVCVCEREREREIVDTQGVKTQRIEYAS